MQTLKTLYVNGIVRLTCVFAVLLFIPLGIVKAFVASVYLVWDETRD
jgi:hypothetical protein